VSYGAHEMLFDALDQMRKTYNVLKANEHLSPSLAAEAMVLNSEIARINKELDELP